MLAPAGVLVLLMLGAISVDSAVAFGAQRELTNQATAAVNDAATLSLTDAELQLGADARIDAPTAARLVEARLLAVRSGTLTVRPDSVRVLVDEGAGRVSVIAEGDAPYIFSKAIPGARDSAHVKVQATAELRRQGPDAP